MHMYKNVNWNIDKSTVRVYDDMSFSYVRFANIEGIQFPK